MEEGVTLREYVEALLRAQGERMVEARAELNRRLDESAHDRERIRASLTDRVSRAEFDQVLARLSSVERTQARIAGALAVVVLLASILGVVLRYLVG
jgi:siroheme synthase (precorrin-2 oxidase/ferrochelatase)